MFEIINDLCREEVHKTSECHSRLRTNRLGLAGKQIDYNESMIVAGSSAASLFKRQTLKVVSMTSTSMADNIGFESKFGSGFGYVDLNARTRDAHQPSFCGENKRYAYAAVRAFSLVRRKCGFVWYSGTVDNSERSSW
jgi:hypothetical protein